MYFRAAVSKASIANGESIGNLKDGQLKIGYAKRIQKKVIAKNMKTKYVITYKSI